jgi:hypothetical protein
LKDPETPKIIDLRVHGHMVRKYDLRKLIGTDQRAWESLIRDMCMDKIACPDFERTWKKMPIQCQKIPTRLAKEIIQYVHIEAVRLRLVFED